MNLNHSSVVHIGMHSRQSFLAWLPPFVWCTYSFTLWHIFAFFPFLLYETIALTVSCFSILRYIVSYRLCIYACTQTLVCTVTYIIICVLFICWRKKGWLLIVYMRNMYLFILLLYIHLKIQQHKVCWWGKMKTFPRFGILPCAIQHSRNASNFSYCLHVMPRRFGSLFFEHSVLGNLFCLAF